MFVKSFECPDEDASILQDAPHPEVDVLQHLTALPHRLTNKQTQNTIRFKWSLMDFGDLRLKNDPHVTD